MTEPSAASSPVSPEGPLPYDVPEARDLLALFKLAAMDGYNKQPVSTVEEWVEECKKRMLSLYLAGVRDGAPSDLRSRLSVLLADIEGMPTDESDYGDPIARSAVLARIRQEIDNG